MAQGQLKKPSKPSKSSTSSSSSNSNSKATSGKITKKGSRTITPKKASLVRQAKLNKKFTAGLTAKTEAMLGARAGHLEMLGQGKGGKKGQKGQNTGSSKRGEKSGG
ncbi:hypothetical protein CLCR_11050 [Cladophialophora carrionii]|uniref:Uncharacterized protein n=1 Tax=Cladophialophora carrionii TaxID=86049 RepID=A0A1C1CWW7_9EURO|nr:hypothetical protein CLCR_11050 [Cladophialophora carrionii]